MNKITYSVLILPMALAGPVVKGQDGPQEWEGLDHSPIVKEMESLGLAPRAPKLQSIDWSKLEPEYERSMKLLNPRKQLFKTKK